MMDATLIAALAFIVFLGLLVWAKVPGAIAKALDDQSAAISRELDEARRLRAEAEALRSSYAAQESAARAEAEAIVARAQEDAQRLRAEARSQLERTVAARAAAADARIARAEEAAVSDIRAAAANAAIQVAEDVLKATTTGKVASDLLSRSLASVGSRLG
jgi:F-type H+-transporting ATPase subunit b